LAVVGQIYAWFVCVKRGGKSENRKLKFIVKVLEQKSTQNFHNELSHPTCRMNFHNELLQ
jgi:hypothetical protein